MYIHVYNCTLDEQQRRCSYPHSCPRPDVTKGGLVYLWRPAHSPHKFARGKTSNMLVKYGEPLASCTNRRQHFGNESAAMMRAEHPAVFDKIALLTKSKDSPSH